MSLQRQIAILGAFVLLAGCGERAVKSPEELKEVFAKPNTESGAAKTQPPEVQALVNQAATALEKDDQLNAVIALQTLRNTPDLSVDQYIAVQDMMARAQKSLVERAAAGDPAAIAAMESLRYSHRR